MSNEISKDLNQTGTSEAVPETAKNTAASKNTTVSKEPQSAKIAAMQEELLALELEAKRLEVAEKKLNVLDLRERVDERELRRETVRQRSLTNGASLKDKDRQEKTAQSRCKHRKGGNGIMAIVHGTGDNVQYAIMHHTMLNGDEWMRCMRCGKTWKPAVREHFDTEQEYLAAVADYEKAKDYPTNNTPSSTQQFRFSDNGAYFREVMRHTTLR